VSHNQRGSEILVAGGSELTPLDYGVPGDISSAVFFIAAALMTRRSDITIRNVLLNPTRAHILEVLGRMNARLAVSRTEEFPEPVGDISVRHSKLTGTRVGGTEIPLVIDEIPALAACALFARGDTVVEGAEELRIKESDRIKGIVHMIRAFGGGIEEKNDGFVIHGGGDVSSTEIDPFGDHRMAMAASVIALAAKGRTRIKDACCVDISYPGFFDVLAEHRIS
jgi:3-phosphoshikimate 1-carboxyvinyltransferase